MPMRVFVRAAGLGVVAVALIWAGAWFVGVWVPAIAAAYPGLAGWQVWALTFSAPFALLSLLAIALAVLLGWLDDKSAESMRRFTDAMTWRQEERERDMKFRAFLRGEDDA